MSAIKVIGTQAACGTSSGASSNFDNASDVRLVNSGTTVRLVTVTNSGGTTIGTFSLAGSEDIIVRKGTADKIFAAHAEVLGVAVITEG